MTQPELNRCWWCGDDELYKQYHDLEWGVPVHDDRELFEFLCLEGAQAGLSWITILRKREHYRQVFDHFDAEKIVRYDDTKIAALCRTRVSSVTVSRLMVSSRMRVPFSN